MAETYDITYDGVNVGRAQMEKQGLYYVFSCRCRLPQDGLYRIHVLCADKREDLGICVPMGDVFGMDKKLPAKKLGEGTPSFELLPRDWHPQPVIKEPAAATEEPAQQEELLLQEEALPVEELQPVEEIRPEPKEENHPTVADEEIFIPVSEEEPFDHLDKLEDARMEIRNDTPGIVIPMEEE
ncbi:MAG: hypothetical protein IKT52_00250 [Oscillospiraceae bacterium]|nr:hypothetical protein [Oscillospiraceae bacterium]